MTSETSEDTPYRVLARKYRPASFADLIGQEALVRTLTNAIASGRLAHAFILTGVRGVGKTTTARILARALNCIGPDGDGGPTAMPCGSCEHCSAITQDRHVDVIEMDAASRTGIADIRELIEGVRYRPVSARNKIYIIDEVHMLSNQAFNGLLKTLEEPPEHVIFIFATTEIRKVPVTVLSRCQRFDLRRIDQATLTAQFRQIAEAEKITVAEGALAMIARAADGSARDGLSLLDQAIALCGGQVGEEQVRDMLGLADRVRIYDLFEAVAGGRAREALEIMAELYRSGAEPAAVLADLLDLCHFLSRAKLVPNLGDDPSLAEAERVRGRALAEKLAMPALGRTWQILLKGLGETQTASAPRQAADMVLIRLCYASNLPAPGDLVRKLERGSESTPAAAAKPLVPSTASQGASGPRAGGPPSGSAAPALRSEPIGDAAPQPRASSEPAPAANPESFAALVALVREQREGVLAHILEHDVHLVHFESGRLEIRPLEQAPKDLAGRLGRLLQGWTGTRWIVSVAGERGAPTLKQQWDEEAAAWRASVLQDPLVQAVIETFPDARLQDPPRDEQRQAPGETDAQLRSDSGEETP